MARQLTYGRSAARVAAGLALAFALGCASTPTVEDQLALELEAEGLLSRKTDRGLVLYLPDVLFDFDSAALTTPAESKIATVAEIIVRVAPQRRISVEGHSDAIGPDGYNFDLSLERARSVEHQLVASGVDDGRIAMIGFGERFPVAPNRHPDGHDNPEGRAQNRRVEVVISKSP